MQKRARTASDRYFWTSNAFSRRFGWSFLARPATARADRSVTDNGNFVFGLLPILASPGASPPTCPVTSRSELLERLVIPDGAAQIGSLDVGYPALLARRW
jgi:hypothetical protein